LSIPTEIFSREFPSNASADRFTQCSSDF
jgi:hypothetical protein